MAKNSSLVIDLSNNDLGLTDPSCLKSHGVVGVVLGMYSQHNPPHEMVALGEECMRADLPVLGVYGLPYFGEADAVKRDAEWCIEVAPFFKVSDVWLDVETDANMNGWRAPTPSPQQRIEELLSVRALVESALLTPAIYTFRYWWLDQMANTKLFADLKSWLAEYGPMSFPTGAIETIDFGGWADLAAHQFTSRWGEVPPYSAANPRCGRANRDANYWYLQEDEVTKEEYDALVKNQEDIKLAMMSGREEMSLDRAERLKNADYRIAQRVDSTIDEREQRESLGSAIISTSEKLDKHLEDIPVATAPTTVPGVAADGGN